MPYCGQVVTKVYRAIKSIEANFFVLLALWPSFTMSVSSLSVGPSCILI